jgi:hypothetical protein
MEVAFRPACFPVGNGELSKGQSGGNVELATLFHLVPVVNKAERELLHGELTNQFNCRLKAQTLEQLWKIHTVVFWIW